MLYVTQVYLLETHHCVYRIGVHVYEKATPEHAQQGL